MTDDRRQNKDHESEKIEKTRKRKKTKNEKKDNNVYSMCRDLYSLGGRIKTS